MDETETEAEVILDEVQAKHQADSAVFITVLEFGAGQKKPPTDVYWYERAMGPLQAVTVAAAALQFARDLLHQRAGVDPEILEKITDAEAALSDVTGLSFTDAGDPANPKASLH